MTLTTTIQIVQMAYPQVYMACHTRHQRKRTNSHHLSARDSAILAHLSQRTTMVPARLATHLSISRSTLSEALKRLATLGYISKSRTSGVLLTELGARAISETSVLEASRLEGVLAQLTPAERRTVERGLNLLASASRAWSAKQPKSTDKASFR